MKSAEYIERQKARQKTPEGRAYSHAYYEANKDRILAKNKRYIKHNSEKVKANRVRTRLKMLYGLTPERLDEMKRAQDHACAICFRQLPLVVDHSHVTGQIRGLLCVVCNQALGMLQDSPTVLESAQNYLRKHQA